MTPEEERYLLALKRRRAALSAQDDLLSFAQLMTPDPNAHVDPDKSVYEIAKHHRVISAALEEVEKGNIRRLIINLGPRHGKSQLTSRLFPAWYLGRNPKSSLILGTYNEKFSWDFGRDVRGILQDPVYSQVFPNVNLLAGAASVDRLELEQKGKMFFVGRGGSLTGRGGHGLIIDDPIKDRVEADSPTTREKLWNWYNQVLKTRLLSSVGWIVLIQCMTGDTPVLMADGTEKPLRDVRPGDRVSTYREGRLSESVVEKWRSNGRDCIFTITTTSGITVRANERHPFLVCEDGVLKWVRLRNLRRGHEIVRVSGGGGRGRLASGMGVISPYQAEATAHPTTTRNAGPMVSGPRQSTLLRGVKRICGIATTLASQIMSAFCKSRAETAQSANNPPATMFERTGEESYVSIIATTPEKSEGFSVTTAISQLVMRRPLRLHKQQPITSDFILDRIESIEESGVEEVFDVQIAETENFIANGLVSHNTRWHEDDLVGRITDPMNSCYSAAEAKKWRIIDLPALAKENDVLGRKEGEALWPSRFPVSYLHEMREADPRGFQALYQGSPTPEKGNFFDGDRLRVYTRPTDRPPNDQLRFYVASDHAVSLKQDRDKTCLLPVGVDEHDNIWVMDNVEWGRWDTEAVVEKMIDMMAQYKPMLWWAEKGHISKSIGPFLRKRMAERSVWTPIDEITPTQDKQTRAQSLRGRIAMGKVYMPSYAPWYQEARDQMLKFPYGAHDDFVDALAYIGLGLAIQVRPRFATPKPATPKTMTYGWIKNETRRAERERAAQGGGW